MMKATVGAAAVMTFVLIFEWQQLKHGLLGEIRVKIRAGGH